MLVATACGASAPPTGHTPPPQSTLIRGARSSLDVQTQSEDAERVDSLPVPAQRVYDALPGILTSLSLRITAVDPKTLSVSSEGTQFRRVIDGERLSHFFSCGVSSMGNNADFYTLTIRIQGRAEPKGDGASAVHTVVRASARPSDNGSGAAVNCASNGRLESKVQSMLLVKLMEGR